MKRLLTSPDLILITFILCIASMFMMKDEYPRQHNMTENTAKIRYDHAGLKNFYSNTLFHVQIAKNGKQDLPPESEVKQKLRNTYYYDYLFLACYTFLFSFFTYYYSRFNNTGVGLFSKKWFCVLVYIVIAICGISDAVENYLSISFINSDYKDYPVGLSIINIIKTVSFLLLLYVLVIRYIGILGTQFIKLMKKLEE